MQTVTTTPAPLPTPTAPVHRLLRDGEDATEASIVLSTWPDGSWSLRAVGIDADVQLVGGRGASTDAPELAASALEAWAAELRRRA